MRPRRVPHGALRPAGEGARPGLHTAGVPRRDRHRPRRVLGRRPQHEGRGGGPGAAWHAPGRGHGGPSGPRVLQDERRHGPGDRRHVPAPEGHPRPEVRGAGAEPAPERAERPHGHLVRRRAALLQLGERLEHRAELLRGHERPEPRRHHVPRHHLRPRGHGGEAAPAEAAGARRHPLLACRRRRPRRGGRALHKQAVLDHRFMERLGVLGAHEERG
mmetsp:Transcript_59160/g.190283  ORF Transcript_59160/g.190283 Transcript_59160/m.190283 type:complete len:217 (+) Transcript_59160:1824-2474(+)